MNLLEFSRLTIEEDTSPAPIPAAPQTAEQPPAITAGGYYTAQGVVYRAKAGKYGMMLIDINKSWRAGQLGVINGLFERGGRLYAGEYAWSGGKTRWQELLTPSALAIDDLVQCRVERKTIKF